MKLSKSRILAVSISFLCLLSAKLSYAVQETDMDTGETNTLSDDEFVEPVYLDDLADDEPAASKAPAEPLEIDRTPAPVSSGGMAISRPGPRPRDWRVYGSLGMSTVSFAARLALSLPFNEYLSIDPAASYWSKRDGEYAGNGFGPEVAGVARLRNPTMFTPYTGVGIGYEKWQQTEGEETIDENDAGTGFYFLGLNIMMTKHFGVDVARRYKNYAGGAPLDKNTREEGDNPEISTEISFQAVF